MPAVSRRALFGLLAGTAATGLLSACSNTNKCRADYIADYQAKHGGQMPTEEQIASACPTSRSRSGSSGGYYGSGYRGSRRGGGSSSSGGGK